MSISQEGAVLGVDVGWNESSRTPKKMKDSTAVCLLSWTEDKVKIEAQLVNEDTEFRQLERLIGGRKVLAAAIDGPLRGDLRSIGVYRAAEAMLTRRFQVIGKPGQSSSGNGRKLNVRANEIAGKILALQVLNDSTHRAAIHTKAIVEAFPTTFLGVMLEKEKVPPAKRKKRSDMYYECLIGSDLVARELYAENHLVGLIQRLLPGRSVGCGVNEEKDHDRRAAIVCAMTALCTAADQYTAAGDSNGFIILPPLAVQGRTGLQEWAMIQLRINLNGMMSEFPSARLEVVAKPSFRANRV